MQADPRLDTEPQQLVDQPIVEVESLRIRRTVPLRLHARPGDREPIGTGAELAQQGQIFGPAVIMVTGDLSRGAVHDATGYPAKAVPYTRAAPVDVQRTFDLVRAGRDAPDEAMREEEALGGPE
jgi:hypothetical protein